MGAGAKIVYTSTKLGMITLVQYAAYASESLEVVYDNGWELVGYHSIPITLVRMALQPLFSSRYELPPLSGLLLMVCSRCYANHIMLK